jgi:transcription elongation factor Elf1
MAQRPACPFCNDTGCPVCSAWPDPADKRWVCKGCGKRRERPVAHHRDGVLCGPWVAPLTAPE